MSQTTDDTFDIAPPPPTPKRLSTRLQKSVEAGEASGPTLVKVRVRPKYKISEGGGQYGPGDELVTTPERAKQLAHFVEIVQ